MEFINQTTQFLEDETQQQDLIEFTIAEQNYGIELEKVIEIIRIPTITPMQKSHPHVEGIIKPREDVMTVIHLPSYLGVASFSNSERDILIVTQFQGEYYAFHVHKVVSIDRVACDQIKKPDQTIYGGQDGIASGITEYQGRLLTILDFEKIIQDINLPKPKQDQSPKNIKKSQKHSFKDKKS